MSTPPAPGTDGGFDKVLVVDFGAQYAQLIARRVREANVYSEIVAPTISADEIKAKEPTGIIFSGGPDSVHADGAIAIDAGVYEVDWDSVREGAEAATEAAEVKGEWFAELAQKHLVSAICGAVGVVAGFLRA